MSETDNKKSPAKKAAKKAPKHDPVKSNASTAAITTLLFIICISLAGGLYLLWQEQQTTSLKQQLNKQNIEELIGSLSAQQLKDSTAHSESIKEIHQFQENLRHNLTNLIRNKEHLRNDWLMAEAEYLVQLANHRLLLEKDVATAAVALKAADARLAEVADPALLNVRKVLLRDLQNLKNIPHIDIAGLSVTLSALSNNITNLPLQTPDPKTHKITKEEKTSASSEVESIQDLPAAIWKDIKNLIVIRHHEKP